MKKPSMDFLSLPRDSHLNIRVPKAWKDVVTAEWRREQGAPNGERLQTFTDYVIARLLKGK